MEAEKRDKEARKSKAKPSSEEAIQTGIFHFANGDVYDGEYIIREDGRRVRHGQGRHKSCEGKLYSGQFLDDKMNGKGRLDFVDGSIYEGDFLENKFHGYGVYSWPNGNIYRGPFCDNRLQGEGDFTDACGQTWSGTFMGKSAPALKFQLNLR